MKSDIMIDQAILAWAYINNCPGYQVIAKSDGLTPDEADKLSGRTLPGNIPINFKYSSSHNIFKLPTGRICFAKIHNIGIGLDDRANSICSHCFIFDERLLDLVDWNLRLFENFFRADNSVWGRLPRMNTNELFLDDPPIRSDDHLFKGKIDDKQIKDLMSAIFSIKLGNHKDMVIRLKIEEDPFYNLFDYLSFLPPKNRFTSISSTYLFNKTNDVFDIYIIPPEANTIISQKEKTALIDLVNKMSEYQLKSNDFKIIVKYFLKIGKNGIENVYKLDSNNATVDRLPTYVKIKMYLHEIEKSNITSNKKISNYLGVAKEYEKFNIKRAEEYYEVAYRIAKQTNLKLYDVFDSYYPFIKKHKKKKVHQISKESLNIFSENNDYITIYRLLKQYPELYDTYKKEIQPIFIEKITKDHTILSRDKTSKLCDLLYKWLREHLSDKKSPLVELNMIKRGINSKKYDPIDWAVVVGILIKYGNTLESEEEKLEVYNFCYNIIKKFEKKKVKSCARDLLINTLDVSHYKAPSLAKKISLVLIRDCDTYEGYFSIIKHFYGRKEAYKFYNSIPNKLRNQNLLKKEIYQDIKSWSEEENKIINDFIPSEAKYINELHEDFFDSVEGKGIKEKVFKWNVSRSVVSKNGGNRSD